MTMMGNKSKGPMTVPNFPRITKKVDCFWGVADLPIISNFPRKHPPTILGATLDSIFFGL